jgi:antitoxin VapB
MTLTIETGEADALAETLSRLTGESVAEAVTAALRERLARVRAAQSSDMPARARALTSQLRKHYDNRPVTQEELDEASGEPL